MSTIETAKRILREEALPAVMKQAEKVEAQGLGKWIHDPEVQGVVGFVHVENPKKAMIVVYNATRDFELSDAFEESMVE